MRELTLIQKSDSSFDIVLTPTSKNVSEIIIKDIDLRLMILNRPSWTKKSPSLEAIALIDREWNRQQVSFPAESNHLKVSGGDGFESQNLYSVDIANNCLEVGLWEILLFANQNGKKLYYQAWFSFPKEIYQKIVNENGINYSLWKKHLEKWSTPPTYQIALSDIRSSVREESYQVSFNGKEKIIVAGEQIGKLRTLLISNMLTWEDFFLNDKAVKFASFVSPGVYSVKKRWGNGYWMMRKFEGGALRTVAMINHDKSERFEFELSFSDGYGGHKNRLIVGGLTPESIPALDISEYPKGIYRPLGIAIPPFVQLYGELEKLKPEQSPYYAFFLDDKNNWMNHHEMAIDGVAIHRDKTNSSTFHFYIISYERHTLIGHFVFQEKAL